ncbi:MAG TPA: nuclear transport factor 2 family protein [Nocardioidaceae bacterium]|nr:nuclear transport factor 2 family protein [Nocardioidaceae bacterium]
MFDEEKFQDALALPRLRQPLPAYLSSNRGGERTRVLEEDELNAMTRQWFVDFEAKVQFYKQLGVDLTWMIEWSKKYWWSWLVRDMSYNDELYTPDLRYKDVSSFGRILVGLDEFVKYNFAFFDAIPDWRYDPIPGQLFLDVSPEGDAQVAIRYYGSGHFDGSLRLYPYDDSAPAIQGNGAFVQCTAVDRYHFTPDGRMYEGETLFDIVDAVQTAGILPSDQSWQFHLMMQATKIPSLANKVLRRKAS